MNKDRRKELEVASQLLNSTQEVFQTAKDALQAARDNYDETYETLTENALDEDNEVNEALLSPEALAELKASREALATAKTTFLEALETFVGFVEEAKGIVENCKDDEESYKDNIPEAMQGGERYSRAEEAVSAMENAVDYMDEALSTLDPNDSNDYDELLDLDLDSNLEAAKDEISSASE